MADNTTDVENVVDDTTPDAVDQMDEMLNMSDEDFMNSNPQDFSDEDCSADEGEQLEEGNEENSDQSLGDDQDEYEDDSQVNGEDEDDAAADSESDETESGEDDSEGQPENQESNDDSDFDYEAEYKKLFEPIKSSGREIKMRNVEHIRNYIQMGDDYNKKMHELKPFMKSLRSLKEHNILGDENSDDRLNFLIELDQKKPEAIKRLIAESGIDIYELQDEEKFSPEKSKQYRPENQMVSDGEYAIEDALKSIAGTESYTKTIEVMTKNFDAQSRDIIADNPSYIQSLNHDIANGSYDKVMEEVQYARDMKMIPADMPDIQAYIATVQMLNQQAKQDQGSQPPAPQTKQTTRKTNGGSRKKKVGMGSSSSRRSKSKQPQDQNFIGMSDEEFEKLDVGVL